MHGVAQENTQGHPPLRVMALHALGYCERLFYLEEVEEIRVADQAVYAGRRVHETLPDGVGEWTSLVMESEALGLQGRVDCVRRSDGTLVPYEYKKGRSAGDRGSGLWPSDELQTTAYALLLEEHIGRPIQEGRVYYMADRRLISFAIDEQARQRLYALLERAEFLRSSTQRPPVATNERLCAKCSLAPVCLPEEERLALGGREAKSLPRYFPERHESYAIHVSTPGATVKKAGDRFVIDDPDGARREVPVEDVQAIVLHGAAQITTQALHSCAHHEIAVHWVSGGGSYVGGFSPGAGGIQRRIRQFTALESEGLRLSLARKVAAAKVEGQLRYLLRASRGGTDMRQDITGSLDVLRRALAQIKVAASFEALRGYEGQAGRAYFAAMPSLISRDVDPALRPDGRTRRPPRDPFNAVLSYCYSLLYRDMVQAVMTVGLDPCYGFFHTPRSSAYPLALDLMELFRVPVCDIAVVGAINRRRFDVKEDFAITGAQVWLSQTGKKKAIGLYEERKQECWKHPVIGYSLSYARAMELEVRLLEKEWCDAPGLFAQSRLR